MQRIVLSETGITSRKVVALAALGRSLDPVIDGIAQEVQNRVFDRFEDALIEFDIRAADLQQNFFALLPCQVAYCPLKSSDVCFKRNQPYPPDAVLQRIR